MTTARLTQPTVLSLTEDGETIMIHELRYRNRELHAVLSDMDEELRASVILDALDFGIDVLSRARQQGDLTELRHAIELLDIEAKRIVTSGKDDVDNHVEKAVRELSATLVRPDGPFAPLLRQFDANADGNVLDAIRQVITSVSTTVTKKAVEELSEATQDHVERLTQALDTLEKVAAVEEARLVEAQRGHAKGRDHELDVEALLGDIVTPGDSIDDVSTVPGIMGSRRGDKVITPLGGCTIVTEETTKPKMSESKIAAMLDEAMANRGAQLGLFIVPDESHVPGRQPFHLIGSDKVAVVVDPLVLKAVYAYLRAKSLEMAKASCAADDSAILAALVTVRSLIDSMKGGLERFRLIRTEHTKASNAIGQARSYVNELEATIADAMTTTMTVIDKLLVAHER